MDIQDQIQTYFQHHYGWQQTIDSINFLLYSDDYDLTDDMETELKQSPVVIEDAKERINKLNKFLDQ